VRHAEVSLFWKLIEGFQQWPLEIEASAIARVDSSNNVAIMPQN
jgi:hypothetical protein